MGTNTVLPFYVLAIENFQVLLERFNEIKDTVEAGEYVENLLRARNEFQKFSEENEKVVIESLKQVDSAKESKKKAELTLDASISASLDPDKDETIILLQTQVMHIEESIERETIRIQRLDNAVKTHLSATDAIDEQIRIVCLEWLIPFPNIQDSFRNDIQNYDWPIRRLCTQINQVPDIPDHVISMAKTQVSRRKEALASGVLFVKYPPKQHASFGDFFISKHFDFLDFYIKSVEKYRISNISCLTSFVSIHTHIFFLRNESHKIQ